VTVQEIAADFRRRLLEREAVAMARMQEAWLVAYASIVRDLLALLDAAPEVQTVSWILREERLSALLEQVSAQVVQTAGISGREITAAQRDMVAATPILIERYISAEPVAARAALQLDFSFSRLPAEALEQFVGRLSDGSPLRDVFDRYPELAAQRVQDELVQGLAQGRGPREVARRVRQAAQAGELGDVTGLGDLQAKASTIARTEIVGAHREAALANYRRMRTATGWRWLAALDVRTCPVCWAMHGTIHPVTSPFGSHVQCRCSPAPVFASSDAIETGEEAFAKLSPAIQQQILGPGKFALYEAGDAGLSDFVQETNDPRWGPGRREKALSAIT